MAITGAFPYDLNNLLGGATRVLFAPIGVAIPNGPSDIFSQIYPYNPVGTAYVAADAASGATSITVNDGTTLPANGTLTAANGVSVSVQSKAANVLTVTALAGAIPAGTQLYTATAWRDFGATRETFTYGRNVAASGYQLQQVTGDVMEEVTDVQRTASVSIAELRPETLAIIEEGSTGTAESSSYDQIKYGTIHDLTQYRIAFVARRNKQSGIVTETTGSRNRGRFVVGLGYRTQITADNVQVGMAKGELASATITFRFFPETSGTLVEGQEFGSWFLERARTIA